MALVNCPECKNAISDSIEACPHCGYSIKRHMYIQAEKEKLNRELNAKLKEIDNQQYPEKPLMSNEKGIGILSLMIVFTAIFLVMLLYMLADGFFEWVCFIAMCFGGLISYGGWLSIKDDFARHMSEYETKINDWEGYKTNVKNELKEHYAALEKILEKYGTIDPKQMPFNNSPKCPACGSTNVVKISTTKKIVSVELVGLASSNIGKQMECKSCGYKF